MSTTEWFLACFHGLQPMAVTFYFFACLCLNLCLTLLVYILFSEDITHSFEYFGTRDYRP